MKNNMQKYIIAVVMVMSIGTFGIKAQVSGFYPYFEPFTSGTKPDDVIKPAMPPSPLAPPNSLEFKEKGAVLTPEPAATNSFGALLLDRHQFTSEAGIFVSFEYMMYGGGDANGGDGLSVFFYDAAISSPTIGATGRGIGYSYNRSYNYAAQHPTTGEWINFPDYRAAGLDGAYLGIAFDAYGNFKNAFYQGEMRGNGIPFRLPGGGTGAGRVQTNTDNDVVLRGAKNPNVLAPPGYGLGFAGYPVLVQQSTRQNIGHILNKTTDYAYDPHNQWRSGTQPFYLRGGKEFSKPEDAGYRRAYIELFPNEDPIVGGFYVSVMIEHKDLASDALRRDTIIYNYLYTQSFNYLENAYGSNQGDNEGPDGSVRSASPSTTLNATVPAALKIGFAAATGEKTDTHVIKNVRLTLPRAAEAYDDFVDDSYQGNPVTLRPLLNDVGYTGTVSRFQDPCPACIDGETFKFVLDDGTEIFDDAARVIRHTVAGMGEWIYNKDTEIVTFKPIDSFKDQVASIRYNIKGGKGGETPYNDESYRSAPATIAVKIIEDPNPVRKILTNKNITVRTKK